MELLNFRRSISRFRPLAGLVLVLVLISSAMTTSSPSASASANELGNDGTVIRIRKCCPFSEYFNNARSKCETYPASWSSLASSSDLPLSGRSVAGGGGSWSWTPPPKFWQLYSNHTPVLRFERNHTGFPRCATGNEKDLDTKVVIVPKRESEDTDTGNSAWNYDPENETTHFFFKAGSAMLFEGWPDLLSVKTHHKPEHFCADLTDTELILRVCRCSETQPCIRKCCPEGHHITFDPDPDSDEEYLCSADGEEDAGAGAGAGGAEDRVQRELPLHSKDGKRLTKKERAELNPRYIVNRVSCHPGFMIVSSGWSDQVSHFQEPFLIHQGGKPYAYAPVDHEWEERPTGDHCFDRFEGDPADERCAGENGENGEKELLLICPVVEDDVKANKEPRIDAGFYSLHTVAMVVSTILVLVTVIVVFLLLETKNIHSWSRLAYVLSHFSLLFFNGLARLEAVNPHLQVGACQFVAVIIHFTGLMTACWLSIINFDLWWTFKVLKPRQGEKLDYVRFVCYAFFAIGIPVLIVSIGLGIQNQTKEFYCRSETGKRAIPPNYGSGGKCFISVYAKPFYWFMPVCILLVANLIFFLTTTRRMVNLQRITRRASIESTSGQTQSRQIFLKIFIVSGVIWWVEIFQWVLQRNGANSWYWILLEMLHCVQAVAIFIIFVCKRDVIRNLQIKYPIITKMIPPVARLDRSGTQGSMSTTDANSKSFRVNYKLNGRKASTVSSASSTLSTTPTPTPTHGTNKLMRLESIELSASSATNPPSKDLTVSASAKRVQIHEPSSPYFERRDTANHEGHMVDVDLNRDVTNTKRKTGKVNNLL